MEDLIGQGRLTDIDFEALERAARRQALEIAAKAVASRLNADHTDQAGSTLCCACGTAAAYAGRRPKTFTTALGEMRLERAYYHCRHCGEGFFPRDRALGMEKRWLSPAVTRMTGLAAAEVSFRPSGEMLQELAGLRVETKQVECTAKALGAEVAEDELCRVEAVQPAVSTLYLGMDGSGVPVRPSEWEGRPGKQPDGSSKTREVKRVPVWSTSPQCDQRGRPLHDPNSVSYSAAIESAATGDTDPEPSAFAQRVDREGRRRGFPEAQRRVILGDGAAWTAPPGWHRLGARASRPHPVPLAAAELQCDAAGSHPVGGNSIGQTEGEPWRHSRLIQVGEMARAVTGFVRAGRPRSQEAVIP